MEPLQFLVLIVELEPMLSGQQNTHILKEGNPTFQDKMQCTSFPFPLVCSWKLIFILTRTCGFSMCVLLLWAMAVQRVAGGKFKGKSNEIGRQEVRAILGGC